MTDTPQPTYIGGLTWDKQANAAYLAIRADEAGQRHAAVTLRVGNENGTVVAALDFRADGTLMGVELLDADTQLTAAMKATATATDDVHRG
ncbi:DUF2283 domain-containing protein [Nocardia abscessus]|uniref:DUF2283 domain-containing protein n=1 Tax=Nocardia abscessus TaxID=120957 RepID=UPI0002E1FFCE|nr:DUF2283 domain-containing protein [Nocardia abscessus]MCC3331039.1 DUF2283 domain-containing protein [Nocardia abscessus]